MTDAGATAQPFVSVVIPVLNCAEEVEGCISALRAQDYPADRFEILVVDNGSVDDTVARLRACGVTALHRPERGRSRALNTALESALGTIICSTDISCRPEPHWLSEIVRNFEDVSVGCVAGEIKLVKTRNNLAIRYQDRKKYMSPMAARLRLRPPFLPYADGANASFRREVFDAIGPFEESFFKGADVEICYRMLFLTSFRMSFNERAVVWEPGEEDLRALLKQRFRIGMSNVLFRRRFPELFAKRRGGRGYRQAYWWLRDRLAALAAFLGSPASAGDSSRRERLADGTIEWLMGRAQALGRVYGRYFLARNGIEIKPVQSAFGRDYAQGAVDASERIVWVPQVDAAEGTRPTSDPTIRHSRG